MVCYLTNQLISFLFSNVHKYYTAFRFFFFFTLISFKIVFSFNMIIGLKKNETIYNNNNNNMILIRALNAKSTIDGVFTISCIILVLCTEIYIWDRKRGIEEKYSVTTFLKPTKILFHVNIRSWWTTFIFFLFTPFRW